MIAAYTWPEAASDIALMFFCCVAFVACGEITR